MAASLGWFAFRPWLPEAWRTPGSAELYLTGVAGVEDLARRCALDAHAMALAMALGLGLAGAPAHAAGELQRLRVGEDLVERAVPDDQRAVGADFVELAPARAPAVEAVVEAPRGHEFRAAGVRFHRLAQARQLATGIDQRPLHRLVAPQQRAVLGERGDGQGLVAQHGRGR